MASERGALQDRSAGPKIRRTALTPTKFRETQTNGRKSMIGEMTYPTADLQELFPAVETHEISHTQHKFPSSGKQNRKQKKVRGCDNYLWKQISHRNNPRGGSGERTRRVCAGKRRENSKP